MDNNNIDFATIWKQQKVSQPNIEELLHKLKQFKKSSIQKLIISNIILVATSGLVIFIWHYYKPQFITTKIGIVLTIVAMVIFVFSNNKLFSVFNKIDNTKNNNEYLQCLTALETKQKYMQTKMLGFYFITLGLGICLYMYEYTLRMTTVWAIFVYLITLLWISFNWFYIRPKTIKKQQTKLDELIRKFESINKQLDSGE
jgi:Flp pilus assembly protein TadB